MVRAIREIAVRYAWFPVLVFGCHVFSSNVLNAYERFPGLDIPMHLAGGFAIAYFLGNSLNALEKEKLTQPSAGLLRLLLVFGLATTAAVVWEFAEFISDRTMGTHAQVGLEDTLLDILLGMLAASAYLALTVVRRTILRGGYTPAEPNPHRE